MKIDEVDCMFFHGIVHLLGSVLEQYSYSTIIA